MVRLGALPLLVLVAALSASACVLNIAGPDEPGPDGDVTGVAANCSAGPKEGLGAPTGARGPHFVGRFSPTGQFSWSSSQVTARFKASTIAATIELPADPNYDPAKDGRVFSVTLDGFTSELAAKPGRNVYALGDGLDPNAVHDVTLTREFEANGGLATFEGFKLSSGGTFEPAIVRPRRIEVIGDSISCGYGVLGADGSCVFSFRTERQSLTYAAIAAKALDAELTNVSWSGKGLSRNDNGDDGGQPSKKDPTVVAEGGPELFSSIASSQVTKPALPYGFPKEATPQVVLVHLGTNDFNFNVVDAAFEERGTAFLKKIREKYPEAHVFFALSPMLSNTNGPEIRTRAGNSLRKIVEVSGDTRAYYMQFTEQRGARDGLGCDGHPSKKTHELVAGQLVKAIQKKLCW